MVVVDFESAKRNHAMQALVDEFQKNILDPHAVYQIYKIRTENLTNEVDEQDSFFRSQLIGTVDNSRPLTVLEKKFAVSLHLLCLVRKLQHAC